MADSTHKNGSGHDEHVVTREEHAATREIEVSVRLYRDDGQWVAETVDLDVSSCGDTVEEALDNLHDAVVVYLNTIEEEGERERIFRERGIRFLPDQLRPSAQLEPDVLRTALRLPVAPGR